MVYKDTFQRFEDYMNGLKPNKQFISLMEYTRELQNCVFVFCKNLISDDVFCRASELGSPRTTAL